MIYTKIIEDIIEDREHLKSIGINKCIMECVIIYHDSMKEFEKVHGNQNNFNKEQSLQQLLYAQSNMKDYLWFDNKNGS